MNIQHFENNVLVMPFDLRIHVVFYSNNTSTDECLDSHYLAVWTALCRQLVCVGRCSAEPSSPSPARTAGTSLRAGSALGQAHPPSELWKPPSVFGS